MRRLLPALLLVLLTAGCASAIRGHGLPEPGLGRSDPPGSSPPPAPALGQKVFDEEALNRDIAAQYLDKFGEQITVDCPADQPVVPGTTFDCRIPGSDGIIEVIITSAEGDYNWKPV